MSRIYCKDNTIIIKVKILIHMYSRGETIHAINLVESVGLTIDESIVSPTDSTKLIC